MKPQLKFYGPMQQIHISKHKFISGYTQIEFVITLLLATYKNKTELIFHILFTSKMHIGDSSVT